MRWFGVGQSSSEDSAAAGAEAARASLRGPDPRLLLVFASPRHDLRALSEAIRGEAPEAPLVGCSTAGEIAGSGPRDSSVVVSAFE